MSLPFDRIEEGADALVGLRILSRQVDRVEGRTERIEEVKLPEIMAEIQTIKERLAGGFITDDDCRQCKETTRRNQESIIANVFKSIPIIISIGALVVVILK